MASVERVRVRKLSADGRFLTPAAFAALAFVLAACTRSDAEQQAMTDAPVLAVADSSDTISGAATVTDGDTIRIRDVRIRLGGIDSPERGASCGAVDIYDAAGETLRRLIGQQQVNCSIAGEPDRYGRQVGHCAVGDVDLNARMVEVGMARDWPRYSGGAYADEEAIARAQQIGVWASFCPADLWGERDYSR